MATIWFISLKDDGQVEQLNQRGQRTINEAEANIVRRIFSEYVAGNSPRKIAASLNADTPCARNPEPLRGGHYGISKASTINGNQKRRNGILNKITFRTLSWPYHL